MSKTFKNERTVQKNNGKGKKIVKNQMDTLETLHWEIIKTKMGREATVRESNLI